MNGYPGHSPNNVSQALGASFYRAADDRWIMPLNPYPKLKVSAQRLLDPADNPEAVARAISRWKAHELEEAAAEAGVVAPMVRSALEYLTEPHYEHHLANASLIEITKTGESEPIPFSADASTALDGVRALGMGHVIAGAGAGRALALHGADVLNIWRPNEFEWERTYISANVGVRSATIDLAIASGRRELDRLIDDADIFYANRRPADLARLGLSAEEPAARKPGIIHVTSSFVGREGPWANRVGFDQSAGCVTGMLDIEGDGNPKLPPIFVVNDYIVSWLMAVGAAEALMRRAVSGGSYRVHVSLTRVALWVLSMGIFDRGYASATAGQGDDYPYLDLETFVAKTPLGAYTGVTEQVRMSVTPGRYQTILVPARIVAARVAASPAVKSHDKDYDPTLPAPAESGFPRWSGVTTRRAGESAARRHMGSIKTTSIRRADDDERLSGLWLRVWCTRALDISFDRHALSALACTGW